MFLSERPLLLYDIICGSLKFGLAMLVAVLIKDLCERFCDFCQDFKLRGDVV